MHCYKHSKLYLFLILMLFKFILLNCIALFLCDDSATSIRTIILCDFLYILSDPEPGEFRPYNP